MSEDNNDLEESVEDSESQAAEMEAAALDAARTRATSLGIKFHPNTGLKKLSKLIEKKMEENVASPPEDQESSTGASAEPIQRIQIVDDATGETKEQRAKRIARERDIRRKRNLELVRVRITCMNPNKKDWDGEILQVANKEVKIKRYVPFNAENGWHVERMLLDMMREKKCQMYRTVTRRDGNKVRQGYLVPEFSIQELEPLTQEEIDRIAVRQAAEAQLED